MTFGPHRFFFNSRLGAAALLTAVMCGATPATAAPRGSVMQAVLVPHNVSYWEMFAGATVIVKLVMVLLLIASIATWTIWLSKTIELRNASQRLARDVNSLAMAKTTADVGTVSHGAAAEMLQVARAEAARTGKIRNAAAADGLKDRITARLFAVEGAAAERLMRGASVLATVGAIAPFVGLFGTVWGIMNSFIGISQTRTTNLAVVAPGIAEALLATAMGLVAAIPAVIMYNHIARKTAGLRRQLSETSINVACLFSHDVDCDLNREKIVRAA